MLRELELLPVWKLRAPVEVVQATEVKTKEFDKVEAVELEKSINTPIAQYEITLSQDKNWAFVCENSMPAGRVDIASQSMLFNNILHALSIEKSSKIQVANTADVQMRVIVAMGKSVAQRLLNTQASLEDLRGKLHPIGNAQLLVTCDLAHLLNNPLDKAKVWQDLCLARSYLQGLHARD
jgi:uracil-DNA glycosylase